MEGLTRCQFCIGRKYRKCSSYLLPIGDAKCGRCQSRRQRLCSLLPNGMCHLSTLSTKRSILRHKGVRSIERFVRNTHYFFGCTYKWSCKRVPVCFVFICEIGRRKTNMRTKYNQGGCACVISCRKQHFLKCIAIICNLASFYDIPSVCAESCWRIITAGQGGAAINRDFVVVKDAN